MIKNNEKVCGKGAGVKLKVGGAARHSDVVTEEESTAHGGASMLAFDETEAPSSSPTCTAAIDHPWARHESAPLGSPASMQDSKACTWAEGGPVGRPATTPGSFQDLLELARQYCATNPPTGLPGLGSALLRGRGLAVGCRGGSPSRRGASAGPAHKWSPSPTRSPTGHKSEAGKARRSAGKARPVWRQIAHESEPKPFV